MVNHFSRWQPHSRTTIAYKLFRADLVELNAFTWNTQGALEHARKLLTAAAPGGVVRSVLDFGKDLGRRGDTPVARALIEARDVENWARLATVMYAASSLELYVRRVISLSLLSDPGLLIGKSRVVDGVSLLKSGTSPDIDDRAGKCTHGLWSIREREISRVYGKSIPEIANSASDLHFLQTLRNSIAHDFARFGRKKDFWYLDPEQADPQPIERISAQRVQNLLRTISLVAEKLDETARDHIGSFELFQFWHQFQKEKNKQKNRIIKQYVKLFKEGSESKLLSTFHHQMVGGTLGREYCEKLIRHYSSC